MKGTCGVDDLIKMRIYRETMPSHNGTSENIINRPCAGQSRIGGFTEECLSVARAGPRQPLLQRLQPGRGRIDHARDIPRGDEAGIAVGGLERAQIANLNQGPMQLLPDLAELIGDHEGRHQKQAVLRDLLEAAFYLLDDALDKSG